jgi:hypothetical protein
MSLQMGTLCTKGKSVAAAKQPSRKSSAGENTNQQEKDDLTARCKNLIFPFKLNKIYS